VEGCHLVDAHVENGKMEYYPIGGVVIKE